MGQVRPGEEHALLARGAGEWDCVTSFRPTPDAAWEKGKGSESVRVIAGGLWVVGEFKGEFLGAPFEGHSVTGFDQQKKKYVGTWVDSMTSSVVDIEGTYDEGSRTFTFTNRTTSPESGESMVWKSVQVNTDDDHHTYTASMPGPDGKEFEMLRIEYSRRAAAKKTAKAVPDAGTADASLAGTWDLEVRYGEDGDALDYKLRIEGEKDAFKAVLVSPRSGEHPFKSVAWKDGALTMHIVRDFEGTEVELVFEGKRSDAGLAGKIRAADFDDLQGSWSAKKAR